MRLSFDDDPAINEVVTHRETFHANVEVAASACEIEQCGVALRKVDAKPPMRGRRSRRRHRSRALRSSGTCIIWRGMPKVRSLVKQSTRVANCLGAETDSPGDSRDELLEDVDVIQPFIDRDLSQRSAFVAASIRPTTTMASSSKRCQARLPVSTVLRRPNMPAFSGGFGLRGAQNRLAQIVS
jgi:hypothetical protein